MGRLDTLVNIYLRKQQEQQTRLMRLKLHPSTIGMCQRRIVFDMIMVPKTMPEDRLLKVFENGHSMHHRYQTLFADMGILIEDEMKLQKGDITGSTDALIKIYSFDQPGGEELLVELKSAAENSFKWMKEKNQPKTEHKHQLQFYMHLSRVGKGILYVENKDTQEVWEYPMTYDPEFGQELESRALWLIDLAKKRMLPPIPKYHTPSFYKCNICDYNFYCHYGNTKNNGEVRFPIPFNYGSEAYDDVMDILHAIEHKQPIPDVLPDAATNGDLLREVKRKNELFTSAPNEIIQNYKKQS